MDKQYPSKKESLNWEKMVTNSRKGQIQENSIKRSNFMREQSIYRTHTGKVSKSERRAQNESAQNKFLSNEIWQATFLSISTAQHLGWGTQPSQVALHVPPALAARTPLLNNFMTDIIWSLHLLLLNMEMLPHQNTLLPSKTTYLKIST